MTPDEYTAFIDDVASGITLKRAIANARTSWRALSLLIESDPVAASRYARARSDSAHAWADRAVTAVAHAKTGEEAQIARVKSDVYRWRAGVADPKGYGTRVDVQATTAHEVTVRVVRDAIALPVDATARLLSAESAVDALPVDEGGAGE